MIRWLLALLLISLAGPVAARDLTVMSFNIRLPIESDGVNRWEVRRDVAAAMIRRAAPDVIGTQELFRRQGDDLIARLPRYRWIGIDRRGGSGDEHMGIFYRADRLRVERWGNFWLSDTPEVAGSISWGHPYPRMVTWAIFADRAGGRFALFNTHLPYRPEDEAAREKGVALLLSRIGPIAGALPVVVTGDFNTIPDSATHRRMASGLRDLWDTAAVRREPAETFHNFTGTPDRRIDWIFARGFAATRVETITMHRGAVYPSDHYPLVATLKRD